MYPAEIVLPMKAELVDKGFEDLDNTEKVEAAMSRQGSTLLVINSVCGCSAGTARPGVLQSLQQSELKPNHLITTFAGFDTEATQKVRNYLLPYPPSSPCIALFKNGELVHMIERHMIEGRSADMISANLVSAYNTHCN